VCGICGKLNFGLDAPPVSPGLLKAMADKIAHRGPDDEGYYAAGPVGFGFRRLSIIDLATGHQPLANEDGTVWIVFNGEIYNYEELRQYLVGKGHVFRTQTDTEVIVHLWEQHGADCVEKLRGMFAFAIWDERQQSLFLARDRVGIKPLYYWLSERSVVFGSEIKAILADPEVKAEVLAPVIDRFLRFNYLPGEETLFRNILKLAPGCCMLVKGGKVQMRRYWDLSFAPSGLTLAQAEAGLLALLDETVRLHQISDVPVGFLLSGGVDSTVMLSLASGKARHPISSYTIGFSDPSVTDERPYARLAAGRYGSDHHEITITSREFQDFLPDYVRHMEEPVYEPPAVALYYVSKLAKDFVKVLISGEGGDEAFAGYQNYRSIQWIERAKRFAGPFGGALSNGVSLLGRAARSQRISQYGRLLGVPFESYYYGRTYSPFSFFNSRPDEVYSADFAGAVDKDSSVSAAKRYLDGGMANDVVNRMLYVDTKTWLPDDLLLKADKITMANSIELRVPFLDHKVLEFAASLPGTFKVRGFVTKYIAKRAFRDLVPKEIMSRRKVGFPVPYAKWLRTDLSGWLRDILLDRETLSRGYLKKSGVERLISANTRSGEYSKELFSLAVLELWHREFLGKESSSVPPPTSLDSAACFS
jgi:asparagine synthase (glutamine-hydrolysing)